MTNSPFVLRNIRHPVRRAAACLFPALNQPRYQENGFGLPLTVNRFTNTLTVVLIYCNKYYEFVKSYYGVIVVQRRKFVNPVFRNTSCILFLRTFLAFLPQYPRSRTRQARLRSAGSLNKNGALCIRRKHSTPHSLNRCICSEYSLFVFLSVRGSMPSACSRLL